MKVKEFITKLLDFNMEADIFIGDNIDNMLELSWEFPDSNSSIEEQKRKTKTLYININRNNEVY